MKVIEKFSTTILRLNNSTRKNGISVARIFTLIGRDSSYILTFIAFFLVLIPLPTPPGFSTILALPSVFISAQIALGKKVVWIPRIICNLRINKNIIRKIDEVSRGYLVRVDKITQQRFSFIVSGKITRFYNLLLFVLALCSAVPIPFLCMVPACAGLLISTGLVVKDGLITIVGLIVAVIGMSSIWFAIQTFLTIKNLLPL